MHELTTNRRRPRDEHEQQQQEQETEGVLNIDPREQCYTLFIDTSSVLPSAAGSTSHASTAS